MEYMAKTSIRLTRYLMYSCVSIWTLLAIILAAGFHPAVPEAGFYRWGLTTLSMLAGVVLLIGYQRMVRRGGLATYGVIGVLASISLLTIVDQFGFVDLLVLLIHLLALSLLIKDRRFYLRST